MVLYRRNGCLAPKLWRRAPWSYQLLSLASALWRFLEWVPASPPRSDISVRPIPKGRAGDGFPAGSGGKRKQTYSYEVLSRLKAA